MSRDRFRTDEDFPEGEAIEVDPIDIVGDPNAQEIAIDPIAIEGEGRSPYSTAPGGKTPPPTLGQRVERGEALSKDEMVDYMGQVLGIPGIGAWGRSAAQAVTLDHADEIAAAGQSAIHGEDYGDAVARLRSQDELADENYPVASGLGTATGVAATLPLLGGTSAESAMGRVAEGIAEGAGFGALGASGASEGALFDDEWTGDVTGGAVGGAVVGGAFSGLGEGARRMVNRLRDGAGDAARRAAVQRIRQAGPERLTELDKVLQRGGPEEIVGDLRARDPELFGRMGLRGSDDIAGRVADMGGDALGEAERIRAEMSGRPAVLDGAIAQLRSALAKVPQFRGSDGVRNRLRNFIGELSSMADEATFDQIDGIRRFLGQEQQKAITAGDRPMHDAIRAQYAALQRALEDTIEAHSGQGAAWRDAMRGTELGIAFGDLGRRSDLRDAANRAMSPTDYAAAIAGSNGGAGDSVMAILANRLLRGNEPALRANWNEMLARVGRAMPEGDGRDALDIIRRAMMQGGASNMDEETPDVVPPPGGPAEALPPVEVGGDELTPEDAEALDALGLGDAPDDDLTDEDRAALEALGL